MKKVTSSFLAFIATCIVLPNAYGQITLTQANMPSAGTIVATDSDLTPTVTPGSKGPSQTWNFTGLNASKTQTNDFVTASSTPNASNFPLANLADSIYGVSGYSYFSSTASAFSIAGITDVAGYVVNAAFNPLYTQLNFPVNYLNTISGIAYAKIAPLSFSYLIYDSAQGNVHITYADTIDAWGTLTTPAGSYSVLREKHYELDIDSLYLHNSITKKWAYSSYSPKPSKAHAYVWYTNTINYPLIQMAMDTTNTKVKTVTWCPGPLGIANVENKANTLVYPNPCSTQVSFICSTQDARYISIFDISGRQIEKTTIKNAMTSLNTSTYAKGMYFYNITDIGGNILDRGKFSVQ